ncbi:MAG TPA: hypothetical protein VM240_09775 [Verrucomicrobiae bacterium]|nr:hypothetical protein [Verrucomicrobiae bacterium]
MATIVRALLLAVLLPAAPTSAAPPVTVERIGCKEGVRLVAHGAPLSQVMETLSRELGFTLKFQGEGSRVVDTELTRQPAALLRKLLEGDNVVVDEVPDRHCPGRQALARVWVLPRGEDAPRPHEPTPQELYRRAHGMTNESAPPEARDPVPPAR